MQQYGNHIISDHNHTSSGGLLAGGADTCNPGCTAEDPEEKEVMTNVFDRTDPGYSVDRVTMWSVLRGICGSPFVKSPWPAVIVTTSPVTVPLLVNDCPDSNITL